MKEKNNKNSIDNIQSQRHNFFWKSLIDILEKNINKYQNSNNLVLFLLLLAYFTYIYIVNAWVCDDAFITFRTVDNFINGYGLTWNINHRVQSYTNPLWMLLVSVFYFFTREPFITSIALSYIINILIIYLIYFKISKSIIFSSIIIITLTLSKSFIDYSSSGLENSLTNLLLTFFIFQYNKYSNKTQNLFNLSFIASLILLNRLDSILLILPIMLYFVYKNFKLRQLKTIFLGFLPFILWEIFAVIYYGFPFPNTGYAKLNNTISGMELVSHGFYYIYNSLSLDTITLVLILLSTIYLIYQSTKKKNLYILLLIAGILLYFIYLIKIGGDFMSGRFLVAPFIFVLLIVLTIEHKYKTIMGLILLLTSISLSVFNNLSPIYSNAEFGKEQTLDSLNKATNPWWYSPYVNKNGIADERAFYYSKCGLLPVLKSGNIVPIHHLVSEGVSTKNSEFKTILKGAVGMFGFYSGQNIHIIDLFALTDALIARLPNKENQKPKWRIGHFQRDIPEGYFETHQFGKNVIKDNNLSKLYEIIKTITDDNVFSINRFIEIWRINTGYYNKLMTNNYQSILNVDLYPSSGDSISISKYFNNHGVLDTGYNKIYFYKKAYSYNKYNSVALLNIADIFVFYKQYDSAKYYIKKISEIEKNMQPYMESIFGWANYYAQEKEFLEAINTTKIALAIDSTNSDIYADLGSYYVYYGDINQARLSWEKAINYNENHLSSYYNLFKLYYFAYKDYRKAIFYAEKFQQKGGILDKSELDLFNKMK